MLNAVYFTFENVFSDQKLESKATFKASKAEVYQD